MSRSNTCLITKLFVCRQSAVLAGVLGLLMSGGAVRAQAPQEPASPAGTLPVMNPESSTPASAPEVIGPPAITQGDGNSESPDFPLFDPLPQDMLGNEGGGPGAETESATSETEKPGEEPLRTRSPLESLRRQRAATTPEAVEQGIPPEQMRRQALNVIQLTPRETTRRTAIHQAITTGETILSNLSSLRGEISSPFLPTNRRVAPAFRIGVVDFRPRATAGIVATQSKGGEEGEGGHLGGFFQAGITAAIRDGGWFSGALDYAIGIGSSGGIGNGNEESGIDQQVLLSTLFSFPEISKVQFGLGVNYATLSGLDRDVGGDARRTLVTPTFSASYAYSHKTSFDFDVSVPIRDFGDGTSSIGVTTSLFVNNQVTHKTRVGMGVAVGTLMVDGSNIRDIGINGDRSGDVTQWFEQLLLRATYRPSQLFSFDGTAGVEFRQTGGNSDVNPIFGLGATWNPQEGTAVTFAAERRTLNSGTALDTNYTTTSFNLTVSQRIGYRLTASLGLGFEYANYEGASSGGESNRIDRLFEVNVGFAVPITRRWSCALTLSAGENRSNVQPFEFYQAVLQTSYAF